MSPNATRHYIVAGSKPWNKRVFDEIISKYPGAWHYIGEPEMLDLAKVLSIDPEYIFFLHWSWKVPREIIQRYECVCFHMTDLPFGRGGSPLQNLIIRGFRHTKLTALKMVEDIDAGPVYLKEDLCLEGNAEEILMRASYLAAKMIRTIVDTKPVPQPQVGEVVKFRRRRPEESSIPPVASLVQLYDFIRMLDAEGYPKAFIEVNGFRYEFSRASLYDGRIVADVTIRQVKEG